MGNRVLIFGFNLLAVILASLAGNDWDHGCQVSLQIARQLFTFVDEVVEQVLFGLHDSHERGQDWLVGATASCC